jgi:hypothetical protein
MKPLSLFKERSRRPASRKASTSILVAVMMVSSLVISPAQAAFVPPGSTQFDMTGFLQAATLGGPGDGAHQGGTLTLDNQVVTVPAETIVILPANALTWQELFAGAPTPYGVPGNPGVVSATTAMTGLALADVPAPPYTYEVHVVGNRVGNAYIAGLVDIAQVGLNSGAGYINYIDYTTGEFRVGGVINSSTTGARVQLNDPLGRFGRPMSADPRFTVDADNPTVAAGTGFPMCIPRTDPAAADDPKCPQGNRPPDIATGDPSINFMMNDPALNALPDPRLQAPMEVGDYVIFAGTLINDTLPDGTPSSYISAHTVSNNASITTSPGTNPAYVTTEVTIIGTGGLTVLGAGEAAIRTRFEGMTTDPSRRIHLYGIDVHPDGTTTDRDWGTIGVDPGPAGGAGAVTGRWRFRPPCDPFGTVEAKPDKKCVMNAAGTFLPPTREVRAVIEAAPVGGPVVPAWVPGQTTAYANGIIAGQYHAPILEYIFPENIPGSPMVPNNFEALPFLACGGYTSAGGTIGAPLNPWPGATIPSCAGAVTAPVANAGPDQTVASGSTVTMAGSATGTTPITFTWAQDAADGLANQVAFLPNANDQAATFTAPTVALATVLHFTLTATNAQGTSNASMTVTVNASDVPTVNHVPPVSVFSGAPGSFTLSGTDPGGLPLSYVVTQTPFLANLTLTPSTPTTGPVTVTFRAPTLPLDQIAASVSNLSITASNTAGAVSAAETTTLTVKVIPDVVTITDATYRTAKQRLILTAASSVISPNIVLTLQPYMTEQGTVFTPPAGTVFVNAAGILTLDAVGMPAPACNLGGTYLTPCGQAPLIVTSNKGGTSAPHALDLIRL